MRYSNRLSKWMLAAGMLLASASALPAQDGRNNGYGDRAGVRSDFATRYDSRDTRRDYRAADRLRDQIAATAEYALFAILEIIESCHENDGRLFVLRQPAQFFAQFKARQSGHVDIQQHEVVISRLEQE